MDEAIGACAHDSRSPKQSRYATFRRALEYLATVASPMIVELGTARSFVSGTVNQDPAAWNAADPATWDHGAGIFTYLFAEALQGRPFELQTVDNDPAALRVGEVMTEALPGITYHCRDSSDYLRDFVGQAHLIYMDHGETWQGGAQLHARDAVIIVERDLVVPGGIVLIDDVRANRLGGKGSLSVNYLLANGFTCEMDEYQVLLRRNDG
jgi:hypothetical protein